jgi:hypothetical protein
MQVNRSEKSNRICIKRWNYLEEMRVMLVVEFGQDLCRESKEIHGTTSAASGQ